MFFHIKIKKKSENKPCYIYDYNINKLKDVMQYIVKPYLNNTPFFVNGCELSKSSIEQINIFESDTQVENLTKLAQSKVPKNVLMFYSNSMMLNDSYMNNITRKLLFNNNLQQENISIQNENEKKNITASNKKIFIVHGHDEHTKSIVSNYIYRLGLEPIILHEEADNGDTIIEKIENNSDVGYAVILYTACDIGSLKDNINKNLNPRARQNVVFEHGYFIGKLGRKKVIALIEQNTEKPGDIDGVVFIPYSKDKDSWKLQLRKNLLSAGFILKE